MPRRKIALGDVLLAERLMIARAHEQLRHLAQNVTLPHRLRDQAAEIALLLAALGRDVAEEAEHTVREGGI